MLSGINQCFDRPQFRSNSKSYEKLQGDTMKSIRRVAPFVERKDLCATIWRRGSIEFFSVSLGQDNYR